MISDSQSWETSSTEISSTERFEPLLPQLREKLGSATRALVCLDFDGTLAPIVEDPDDASITPTNEAALEALASTSTITTAVISGRNLSDVVQRVDLPIQFAGNHGLELYRNGERTVHPVAKKRARIVESVCTTLENHLEDEPGCHVENKRLTGTVHVRSLTSTKRDEVIELTRRVVERIGSGALQVSRGKCIVEFSPAIGWGKGDAVELIEAQYPGDIATIYVGDDVTDEAAFRAVEPEETGIYVGSDESVASSQLDSPADVGSLLNWLETTGTTLLAERHASRSP